MSRTIIEQLAGFTTETRFDSLPPDVVEECKRDLLDAIGCALAAADQPKGVRGVECARRICGSGGAATVIGTRDRFTVFGAAFANGELMSALDMDSVLLPGHVGAYVLPGAIATAEARRASGKEILAAVSVSHEMSFRFGSAMGVNRSFKDGKPVSPAILGYTSTIFGAAASVAKLKGLNVGQVANALGIAAAITPVNAHRAWLMHAPAGTIKDLMAGALTNAALTAAEMGELGHRGDLQTLDDSEFGYARFIGTTRWVPENLISGLGSEWRFPRNQSFKPYPHCRVNHAPLDVVTDVVARHDIKAREITAIRLFGEAWAMTMPTFLNRDIQDVQDAQFSFAHGLAVAAHRITPGKAWQSPAVVFDPSVMALMNKVTLGVHPEYFEMVTRDPTCRPTRVEIEARGQTFVGEKLYPKGTRSSDPESFMTTEELVRKFRKNADGVLSASTVDSVVESVINLEAVADFASVARQLARSG